VCRRLRFAPLLQATLQKTPSPASSGLRVSSVRRQGSRLVVLPTDSMVSDVRAIGKPCACSSNTARRRAQPSLRDPSGTPRDPIARRGQQRARGKPRQTRVTWTRLGKHSWVNTAGQTRLGKHRSHAVGSVGVAAMLQFRGFLFPSDHGLACLKDPDLSHGETHIYC